MFLTKKNASLTQKGKNTGKKRPLGGWEDDQEDIPSQQTHNIPVHKSKTPINLLDTNSQSLVSKQIQKQSKLVEKSTNHNNFSYQDWDSLNDRNDIQCEKIVIQNIVNLGGIRVKPTDSTLSQFLKQIRGMGVEIIGSLLLSKLEVNYPFQVKAKALYIIQHLLKKDKEYQKYFKHHSDKIKEFPQPEDNVENYKKIQRNVLSQLGTQVNKVDVEVQKPTFIDPGYYQQPQKSQISSFLEVAANKQKKNEGKKKVIGPGQKKDKKEEKNIVTLQKEGNLLQLSPQISNKNVENDLLS